MQSKVEIIRTNDDMQKLLNSRNGDDFLTAAHLNATLSSPPLIPYPDRHRRPPLSLVVPVL